MPDQVREQPEFQRGQSGRASSGGYLPGIKINGQPVIRVDGAGGFAVSFQNDFYFCKQDTQGIGLLYIVIASDIGSDDLVVIACASGDEQDGNVCLLAQLPAQFKAAAVPQVDVQQKKLGGVFLKKLPAFGYAVCRCRFYAEQVKIFGCAVCEGFSSSIMRQSYFMADLRIGTICVR